MSIGKALNVRGSRPAIRARYHHGYHSPCSRTRRRWRRPLAELDRNAVPDPRRVVQPDPKSMDLSAWSAAVRWHIDRCDGPVWIIAHGFGCLAAVRAAFDFADRIEGALLVTPFDPDICALRGCCPRSRSAFLQPSSPAPTIRTCARARRRSGPASGAPSSSTRDVSAEWTPRRASAPGPTVWPSSTICAARRRCTCARSAAGAGAPVARHLSGGAAQRLMRNWIGSDRLIVRLGIVGRRRRERAGAVEHLDRLLVEQVEPELFSSCDLITLPERSMENDTSATPSCRSCAPRADTSCAC